VHAVHFLRASSAGLGNEYGADAHFMVLELRPGALAAVRGVVKYAGEFSQLA
jgi:predicted N-acetyltransferase YhbS